MSNELAVAILAAGSGTRMKSATPKPLHAVCGVPMLEHVVRAVETLDPKSITVVASPEVQEALDSDFWQDRVEVVVQDPPRGTGDAVRITLEEQSTAERTLVVYADHPLMQSDDLQALLTEAVRTGALATVLTCVVENAAGYGRIVRSADGTVTGIVERVDDMPEKRSGPTEINTGIMVLDSSYALEKLRAMDANPQTGEVFLTDLVSVVSTPDSGASRVAAVDGNAETAMGVNSRADLAKVEAVMRDHNRQFAMENGVTLIGSDTIFIDADVDIGSDTTILPNSYIETGTRIGQGCEIGPGTRLQACVIGNRVSIEYSLVRQATVGSDTHIGPFSHVRPGTVIDNNVHIGNFGEIKNSHVEAGAVSGHFSYLGDSTVGKNTNIGAGTVTCNYDGTAKHHTEIGENVFIGSGSMLVAPLTVGDDAATGAGSVVTKDVEPGSKVVGAPARPIRRRRPRTDTNE